MKRILAILTGVVLLGLGTYAQAAELSGTINLADVGITVDGAVFNGIERVDHAGGWVSDAGDINGDGVDDLLIGATEANPGDMENAGQAYLIYGESGPYLSGVIELSDVGVGTSGVAFNGITRSDLAGAVSNAGDINGDGVDDVLVGARLRRVDGVIRVGETYLIYGQNGASVLSGSINLSDIGSSVEGAIFRGIDADDESSAGVSNAGDINGDGVDDLLIGAREADPHGVPCAGETYLVYGQTGASALSGDLDLSSVGTTIEGVIFNGIDEEDFSGRSVAAAGDINGDGIGDLLIGAFGASGYEGQTYLIYGKTGAFALSGQINLSDIGSTVDGAVFTGVEGLDLSGISVSSAGDVNGDGLDDLLIGAQQRLGTATGPGMSYLVYGQEGTSTLAGPIDLSDIGTAIAGAVFSGINLGDGSGSAVSTAGDINGDGLDDLLVGARRVDTNTGQAYLVYGRSGPGALSGAINLSDIGTTVEGAIFNGVGPFESAGASVSNAGDINADGVDDLLISAPDGDANGIGGVGLTYLIYGNGIVTEGPTTDFMADAVKVNPGGLIQFTDLSNRLPTAWDWTFGLGEGGSTERNPSHLYNRPGLYDVSLTATNSVDSDSLTKFGFIEVVEFSDAAFAFSLETLHPGKDIRLYDRSAGIVESWEWLVYNADGFVLAGSSNKQNPLFSFADPGTYHVQLTIDNTLLGNARDFTFQLNTITVTPVPEPSTLVLLGLGLTALARKVRKRKAA